MFTSAMRPGALPGFFAVALLLTGVAQAVAAERGFPYDQELRLDSNPMKGSKRVPMLEIGPAGDASIEMWCNTIKLQLVVASDTITVVAGTKTGRQCTPDRMRGDDDLLATLEQITNWRREGDLLTLRGSRSMRFRLSTN